MCFVPNAKFALEHECIICAIRSHSLHNNVHIYTVHIHALTYMYVHTYLRKISKMRALVLLLEIVEISVNKLSIVIITLTVLWVQNSYPVASIKI